MDILKKFLPHVIAIAAMYILSLLYFLPATNGKSLSQHDLFSHRGMKQEVQQFYDETGEVSYWSNSMFGGMPTYQFFTKYENNIFRPLTVLFRGGLGTPTFFMFIALICGYLFFISFGIKPLLATIGGAAISLNSYFFLIIEAGHSSKAAAIAFAPLLIAGLIHILRWQCTLGIILFTLGMGLELFANHLQITYYLALICMVMVIVYAVQYIKAKNYRALLKSLGMALGGLIIALMCNFSNIYNTYEYSKNTIRGEALLSNSATPKQGGLDTDYVTRWSYGVDETLTLLVPNYKGGPSAGPLSEKSETFKALKQNGYPSAQAKQAIERMPTYHGTQPFTGGPVYIGALTLILAILGFIFLKGPDRWWILVASIIGILLSWGKNFMPLTEFMLDYFPMYNKFRAPSMTLIIPSLLLPINAIWFIHKVAEDEEAQATLKASWKKIAYIIGGILVLTFIAGISQVFSTDADKNYPAFLQNTISLDRKSLFTSDFIRSVFYILLGIGAIWAYVNKKWLKTSVALFSVLGVLIIADLLLVDTRYLNHDDFVSAKTVTHTPDAIDQQLLQDKDPNYRVFNLTTDAFNETTTSYFHKSIGGYHAAKLRRYQDIIEGYIAKRNRPVLNMLNTKYFIVPGDQQGTKQIAPNPEAFGNAWFVQNTKTVNTNDEEFAALGKTNLRSTAIINSEFTLTTAATADSTAQIKLTSYKPNELVYTSTSAKNGLVVFSEVYYPDGWHLSIDGEEAPIIRANYVLRAAEIPAGKHEIKMTFSPETVSFSENIALAGSCLFILLLMGAAIKHKDIFIPSKQD